MQASWVTTASKFGAVARTRSRRTLKAGGIKQIKALAQTYQMPIIGYTPETNGYPYNMMLGDEHMRRESLDMIKLAMDMAKEMNAGYTLISAAHAGYLAPPNVIWGRLAENLSELCEYAENIGMDLILEPLTPYESNVVCNANDVLHALALVPSPRLFSMVDICAPYVQAEPVMSYFDKLGDKLRHLHIVDSDGASDTHYIPGEGKMPLRELMRDIIERGYEGYCTVELVTNVYEQSPDSMPARRWNAFARCCRRMRDETLATIGDNCVDIYPQLNKAFSGGNAVNVAVYCTRYGIQPGCITWVGDDDYGTKLKQDSPAWASISAMSIRNTALPHKLRWNCTTMIPFLATTPKA